DICNGERGSVRERDRKFGSIIKQRGRIYVGATRRLEGNINISCIAERSDTDECPCCRTGQFGCRAVDREAQSLFCVRRAGAVGEGIRVEGERYFAQRELAA